MHSRALVPLDGTPLTKRALSMAARLARATDAALSLLRIFRSAPTQVSPALAVDADVVGGVEQVTDST